MIGLGTALNVSAILLGSAIGVALGHRLPDRTRDVVTDGLGLVTLLVAALSAAAALDPALRAAVGSKAVLVVLGAVLLGGVAGSLLRVEERLEQAGEWVRRRGLGVRGRGRDPVEPPVERGTDRAADERFVEGFVSSSLLFCTGPLAILGALSDGLGHGIDQLALKAVLDGFAAIAFAATLGWGVAVSALAVGVWQGLLTLSGWAVGGAVPAAGISALTATGGLLLAGIALRLLRIRPVPVGDLLPALVIAPLLVAIVAAF